MALTITYDGYGVVANADALTNDTGGSGTGDWRELGGGSYSLSPDASKYGTTSIGSKYASKSGYTYIDGITPLDFSVGGTEEGQYIYIWVMTMSPTPLDVISTNPYNIVLGDSTGTLNEYTVASKADSNGWDGRWRVFCIDPSVTPSINGGANLAAIDTIGVWVDTNVSVRAESFFISQILCAKGLKVEGTSTDLYGDIVTWAEDYTNRAAGMFQSRGQTYYSMGGLRIHSDTANTSVSADGSNIEYEKSEHYTTSWITSYPTTANVVTVAATGGNTCDVTDTNIGIAGNTSNKYSLVTTNATSYTKKGGYLKYVSGLTLTSNDSITGTVISLSDALNVGTAEFDNNNISDTTSLTSAGSNSGNIVTNTPMIITNIQDKGTFTGSTITTSTLSNVTNSTLVRTTGGTGIDTSGTTTTTSAIDWSNNSSGFTSTSGQTTVKVKVDGTDILTINNTSGDTITVENIGTSTSGTGSNGVSIVTGQRTITFEFSPTPSSYEYRIYTVTAKGSLAGSSEMQGAETTTATSQAYTYSYSAGVVVAFQLIDKSNTGAPIYQESVTYYDLPDANTTQTINLSVDYND